MSKNRRNKRKGEISITYMSGPLDGKTITFEQPDGGDERVITIGRRDSCDIHLHFDNQVSRVHARLGCMAKPITGEIDSNATLLSFWLEDGGSRNGTYLEKMNEPLEERTNIRPGSLFRIGRTWMRLDVPLSFDS